MIAFEELEKALARWKARQSTNGESGGVPVHDADSVVHEVEPDIQAEGAVPGYGSVPRPVNGLPPPPDQTGEINLEEEVLETYDDDGEGGEKQ